MSVSKALSSSPTSSGAAHLWKRNRRTSPWWHPYVGRNCRIVYNEEHMEDPNLTIGPGSDVDSTRGSSTAQVRQPVDERLQKLLDKALYGGGHPSAQKIRNFLNGTWLGEPLHVVLKDVPVGAWTVAMVFDALDLVLNRPEFARACETEAQVVIEQWRVQYNTVRPHSSLGYRPPAPKAILPTPSAATTDKLQTRRYTNNLLGTKSRSAQYRLPIFLVARLTRYPDWGENQWDSTALPIPVGNRANSLGGFGHA